MKFHAKLYSTVVPVEGIIVDVAIVGIVMLVRHVMNLTNSLKYEIGKKSDAGGRRCKSDTLPQRDYSLVVQNDTITVLVWFNSR